ncbi:ferric reductase like transmembrane component [Phlyctema vagabunda]|uniref:ferric-chelate reductase (NADPH) n=1 Tax=Phlyctema vagabunda TaxID=108571 RepID=A0ABR4P9T2_9HELO
MASREQKIRYAQVHDELASKLYAAGVLGIIALITSFRLLRFLTRRYAPDSLKTSALARVQATIYRFFQKALIRRIPGFTSAGHALIVLAYLAINLSLTLTNIDWSSRVGLAKRCGWMAYTNMALIVFLALKNTPLAFMTATSYERINCLHQIGGYTTVAFVILHAALMADFFVGYHTEILLEHEQIVGMVAGAAMIIIGASALALKKLRYEIFYIVHITMFLTIIVTLGFHRPDFGLKAVYVIIFTACVWVADRLIRSIRVLWHSYGNRAIVTPLAHAGTRITLKKTSSSRIAAGSHCFVWIPAIRAFETHPFTIASSTVDSIELVVAAQDGFTKDLHSYARKNPGALLRASFHGPYGTTPDFSKVAERVVLIAGGSGASFTFGIALSIIERLAANSPKKVDFIWVVRDRESISWHEKELAQLQSSPLINLILHASRIGIDDSPSEPTSPISPTDSEKSNAETALSNASTVVSASSEKQHLPSLDVEKYPAIQAHELSARSRTWRILPGRPDVKYLIEHAVADATKDGSRRVAIVACGPEALMRTVRRTTADCITVSGTGPSISLHSEQFGW